MNTSNDELLEKIHKVSLHILLVFDKVCRENNLTYFVDSGTALGAVRHGGFIPWDDDVDVGMPRKDYERFIQIAQEKLPENIFLQTRDTDPAYKHNAAKLRLKGTIFQEFSNLPFKENGFFLDIFPFDNVPRHKWIANIRIKVSRLIFYTIRSYGYQEESPSTFRRFIVKRFIKRLSEKQVERINEYYIKFCRKYEHRNTGKITCYYWNMAQYNTYIFDTEKILPVQDILFEGYHVRIMNVPDYYLKIMYGDYMQLPPEDKRHCHYNYGLIDFGKYI